MKFSYMLNGALALTFITGVAYGQENMVAGASDMEMQVVDKNCWVELYEDTDFDVDDPHVRVAGPFQSSTLEDVAGQNWNNEIESLIVGPNAMVYAYEDPDFSGTEVAFVANQRNSDLADLDLSDDIESLKINCGKD
ncbi:hypothetical protein [Candidatus Nitrospira neomarina]|uniref:Calcium-dependent cell adhesion molecule N-terminal domain-containing protein n=1 Tax=Candidatus Nitrospira neomarina TaxID=3020899 RepID=A0AA96GIZ3_9BACT|nr:hypothetical protein [Candidatus Nitrospira neomarina]WNM62182.1 hypothetical protein PQG83_00115 [Candidatus Nitrospira neomarina]